MVNFWSYEYRPETTGCENVDHDGAMQFASQRGRQQFVIKANGQISWCVAHGAELAVRIDQTGLQFGMHFPARDVMHRFRPSMTTRPSKMGKP